LRLSLAGDLFEGARSPSATRRASLAPRHRPRTSSATSRHLVGDPGSTLPRPPRTSRANRGHIFREIWSPPARGASPRVRGRPTSRAGSSLFPPRTGDLEPWVGCPRARGHACSERGRETSRTRSWHIVPRPKEMAHEAEARPTAERPLHARHAGTVRATPGHRARVVGAPRTGGRATTARRWGLIAREVAAYRA
jgi:hypothetical protein